MGKTAKILAGALILQAAIFYGFSRGESVPVNTPLSQFPAVVAGWNMVQEDELDPEIASVLKADEVISRLYTASSALPAHLFVAYFRSQRTGQAPHSPKNCLPGSGWVPSESDRVTIDIDGRAPIEANRYIIERGDQKSLVLYWYQSRDRVVASEYTAKMFVVADAIRYNRSDTALVRVVVPLRAGQEDFANQTATQFVRTIFRPLRQHFPA